MLFTFTGHDSINKVRFNYKFEARMSLMSMTKHSTRYSDLLHLSLVMNEFAINLQTSFKFKN